ncbi:MAG: TonB-dependent receptor plug domain-containing protein [Bacteroidota bacterium]
MHSKTVFILLFCGVTGWLRGQDAPDIRFTGTFENTPLAEAVAELSQVLPLTFSFAEATLAGKTVNCRFQGANWVDIEACLFRQQGILAETLSGGYVLLKPRPAEEYEQQPFSLRVTDQEGTALPFVTIHFPAGNQAFSTDELGEWEAVLSGKSTDSLVLSFLGFREQSISLGALAGRPNYPLSLIPAGIELASVTVTEYLTDGIATTAAGQPVILQPNRIDALPGYSENEVFRAIELLPGINSQNETASSLQIRGGAQDQNLTLWEGIPIYSSGHYFGMISLFAPDLVDEVKVWRGTADAAYGGKLSGVIEMQADQQLTPHVQAGLSTNLTHGQAFLKTPLLKNRLDLQVAYRGAVPAFLEGPTYNSFRSQVFQGSLIEAVTEFDDAEVDSIFAADRNFAFHEWNARMLWQASERSRFTLNLFDQQDAFDFSFDDFADNSGYRDALTESNQGQSIRYDYQGKQGRSLHALLSSSSFDSQTATTFTEGSTFISERITSILDYTARLDYHWTTATKNIFKVGAQFQVNVVDFIIEETEGNEVNQVDGDAANGQIFATHGTYQWRPAGNFQADIGIRLQYYNLLEQVYAEPRLSARYQLGTGWLLKAAFGVNHQFLNQITELNFNSVLPNRPFWVLSQRDELSVPRAHELSVGFSGRQGGWLFDVEAYYKKIDAISSLSLPNTVGEDGQEFIDFFAEGASRSMGLDVLARKRWGNFRSWMIYTFSKTDLRFEEIDDEYFPAFNDQRHQFNWVNTLRAGPFLFSLGWRIRTGARFTPTNIQVPEEPDEDIEFELDDPNTATLPTYHRMDFSAFYQWQSKKQPGPKVKIGVSLLNLYRRSNLLNRNFFVDFEEERGILPFAVEEINQFGLGITPNISVKVQW